ncbi:hypothetical protein MMC34_001339 [Xylographa carneopallida]|nr:hypothetical protein [Xylographa carneopallida]
MASVQNHWVEPPDNIGLSNGVVTADSDPTIPVWEWGTTHLLEWTTPWEFFNLFLVQDYKPNDEDTILLNATNIASFNWTVATDVIDLNLSRICWFKLHETTSEGDTFFESAAFNISGDPSWPASDLTSTASSSGPTSMSTLISTAIPTPSSASAPTSSTPSLSTSSTPAPGPTILPSSDPLTATTPTSSHPALAIAIGVCIPVLFTISLLIFWYIRSKRRRRISLPPKCVGESIVEMAAEDRGSDVKEMADSQVHELFSPLSELEDDNARWEMAA